MFVALIYLIVQLFEEYRKLRKLGYNFSNPGMKCIGYKEFQYYETGCFSIKKIKELIKKNTRNYAKRQITFFRGLKTSHIFHPLQKNEISNLIMNFISDNFN